MLAAAVGRVLRRAVNALAIVCHGMYGGLSTSARSWRATCGSPSTSRTRRKSAVGSNDDRPAPQDAHRLRVPRPARTPPRTGRLVLPRPRRKQYATTRPRLRARRRARSSARFDEDQIRRATSSTGATTPARRRPWSGRCGPSRRRRERAARRRHPSPRSSRPAHRVDVAATPFVAPFTDAKL